MSEKKNSTNFLLSQPLLSEKKFTSSKIRTAAALLILVMTFALTAYYWQALTWYFKVMLCFFVFALSPSMEDFKFLKLPYDVYKDEWGKYNDSARKNQIKPV